MWSPFLLRFSSRTSGLVVVWFGYEHFVEWIESYEKGYPVKVKYHAFLGRKICVKRE